jgi:DNA-binding XRE family transcriptional regulator
LPSKSLAQSVDISTKPAIDRVCAAPVFQALRLEAGLSVNQLARLVDVCYQTVQRAEEGRAIQYFKALALVEALSQKLGRPITIEDTDLKLVDWR